MTKFLLKCFFTTTVLFLGVLIGIQVASNSMVKMTGEQHYSTETIIKTEKSKEESAVSPTINHDQLTSHDLEAKQAKLESIETFNLFSQMGAMLSDGLNVVFSKLLGKITTTIGDILT